MKKIRINVILPKNHKKEIRERMLKDGYGLREKSLWISEAIESFIKLKEFHNLVELAGLVKDLEDAETVYVTESLADDILSALHEVRKNYPSLEGVKSLIVRASIIRRLALNSTPKFQ